MHTIKDIVKQLVGKSLDAYNTNYTKPINDRINNIVAQAGDNNTEIVDARIDSAGVAHTTLNNRILAETKMIDQQMIEYTGYNLTATETMPGAIQDLEILGNTVQDVDNLADIKSVGVLQEDGTYKMSILSCGKNLFNKDLYKENDNTTKIIKVLPNTKYYLKTDNPMGNGGLCWVHEYNKEGIKITNGQTIWGNGEYTTKAETVAVHFNSNSALGFVDTFILSTEPITQYEPYQENKCDILLPCQLEKVGDIADRLICKDGVWGVEKNVETVVLDGNTVINNINTTNFTNINYVGITIKSMKTGQNLPIICNRFITESYASNKDYEYVYTWSWDNKPCIYINFLKSKASTITEFKQWLQSNNTLVKYQLATPQFISLPRDTQIALNSFFGTTHVYMESGEVEGTIKCKIPKSLGATVQSLNNKTDILSDRIEAIEGLKDSQNMKYETDKGYLVCKETKNGVIDDLKIEGKTLVSLHYKKTYTNNMVNLYNWFYATNGFKVEIGKTYTVIANINNLVDVKYKSSNNMIFSGLGNANKIKTFIAKENDELVFVNLVTGQYSMSDLMILEGDHTQNPPSYFEGLMSVGQDVDKIEVLSNNRNLFDANQHIPNGWSNGNMITNNIFRTYWIKCEPNTTYFVESDKSGNRFGVCCGDMIKFNGEVFTVTKGQIFGSSDDTGKIVNAVFTTDNTAKYLFVYTVNNGVFPVPKIMICKSDTQVDYVEPIRDKKQILFYNENGELEPIQELREWDSIEKHSDNKLYYHKRSGKVVLNGSESWTFSPGHSDITTSLFYYRIDDRTPNSECICDKFTRINGHTVDYPEGVYYGADINIRISTSKLSTQDVTGFKQWLQTNNVTVVYQLAEEEVYELAPLHLDSYANETLILCNSGVISPKMEFSITSHINELIKSQGERINLPEEKVYKYMIVQNRIQLTSMYNSDSVAFKVNHTTYSEDVTEYNEDLYNLILENILVGKDNYNIDKMSNLILDYVSWNQITWEQYDILISLMEMQHRPIIEEDGDIDAIN